ncbi:MAG: DUF2752 domain-containing protein [Candidatus Pacearchaeota archaeon]|nr:DUF2752 domain-containing protein [Candidatus Pacearchaeota archaeon]
MGRELRNIFLDIITFSYPQYRFFTFLFVIIILFIIPVNFLESLPNLSICHRILGDSCYSVGITRGIASLLKGNIKQSLEYNFRAIPTLTIILVFLIFDFIKITKR